MTLPALLAVTLAACGSGAETLDAAPLPPATDQTGNGPDTAGACLAGEPDCEDVGDPNAEPQDLPDPDAEPVEPPAALTVDEVLAAGSIDGPFAVEGYVIVDDEGTRICSALAESYPPQCGGSSLTVSGTLPNLDDLPSDAGVIWSDFPLLVVGTYDGTTFAVAS